MTSEAPISHIPPCDDDFIGRLLQDWCKDCEHALSVHRRDNVCSVCDAIAALKGEVV